MDRGRKRTTKPSKDQVRVWLTTVIGPLASALGIEHERASSHNWSFRADVQDFEFLWPTRKMVSVQYQANLDQFLRYARDARDLAETHDRALDALRDLARRAFTHLVTSTAFRAVAVEARIEESDWKYIAEYVINGSSELPSYYVLHERWNHTRGQFLALRATPSLAPHFAELRRAGEEFESTVATLMDEVRRLQASLADSYKLPPVEPVDSHA